MMPGMDRLTVGTVGTVIPPAANLFKNALRNESQGYDVLWWPDHYMGWFPQALWTPVITPLAAYQPNPHVYFDAIAAIAAVAVRTERIRLGTAVTEPLRRHPVQLAQAFLTLDHLAPGRIICGLGSGEAENLLPYGIAFEQPVSHLKEALQIIRLLWAEDGPVQFEGEHFRLKDAVLGIKPSETGPPPIWIAAHGPRMLDLAARYADGWLPVYMPLEDYRARWQELQGRLHAHGRSQQPFTAGIYANVVFAESHEAAHRLLDAPLLRILGLTQPASSFARHGAVHPLGAKAVGLRDFIPTRLSRSEALALIERVPRAVVETATLHGTPEEVAEELQGFHAVGLRHVAIWNLTFFADASLVRVSYEQLERMRRLLTEVKVA